jgi:hypothetical protein
MDLSDLIAEREIKRALFRFAKAMDERDWDALKQLLTADATGDFGAGFKLKGRDEFVAMFRRFLGNCGPTQHLLGNIVIDVDDPRAMSRCYVRDIHQGKGPRSHLTFSAPGEYHDTWHRGLDGWRITHRRKINLMLIGSFEALGADGGVMADPAADA